MDMPAVQHRMNAAAIFRADMIAGNPCHGCLIAAALLMDNLPVFVRLTVAVMPFHRRNIAAVAVGMYTLCN